MTVNTQTPIAYGRWKKLEGNYMTPGGTPCYVCGKCGGSAHLYGVEFSKRKILCDGCGRVNIYPWETAFEQGTCFWENDEEAK